MTARPLIDAEYDRLSSVLSRFRDEHAMNLEELDGFLAALICGPFPVHPSEHLPGIWGGEMADEEAFSSEQQLGDFLDLIMHHRAAVADTLQAGDVFLPLLLEDDHSIAHANDCAQGFMRGMELQREGWVELLDDEDHGGWLVPIFALAHEHDPDPSMRPYPDPMDAGTGASSLSLALLPGSQRSAATLSPVDGWSQISSVDHPPTVAPFRNSGAIIRAPAGPRRNTSGAVVNPHCTDENR